MGKNKPKHNPPNPPVELRKFPNDVHIDEIIASDGIESIHIEAMDVDEYWMGIYFKGSKKRVAAHFTVGKETITDDGRKTRHLRLMAEIEDV